jgi:hypothetical protein
LKLILDGLGIKHDDCFEKSDLVNRVKEYQASRGRKPSEEPAPKKRESTTK